MIEGRVDELNAALADEPRMAASQIKRFLILHKELDADDGELTRTQKVRRSFIADRYEPFIKALYDGSTRASITNRSDVRGWPQGHDRRRRRSHRHEVACRKRAPAGQGGRRMKADVQASTTATSPAPGEILLPSRTCRCRSAA